MWRSLRLGTRAVVKRPMVALAAALCLATGIAASAVAWTLIVAGVIRPFGLSDANRLLVVWETDPARNQPLIEVSYLNFLDWQRQARTVDAMAAFGSQHWPGLGRIGSAVVPLALRGVSTTFFPTLGVAPLHGRNFDAADARPDTPRPIILSHRLWQTRFGGRAMVGEQLFIDGETHVVAGIMPPGFAYPDDPDAWISVERVLGEAFQKTPVDQQRMIGVLEVLARRAEGASLADVRSELSGIIQALQRQHSTSTQAVTTVAAVSPFSEIVLGQLGARVWIAVGMSAAIFLLACANVGAVRTAQLRERGDEIAARLCLGATRTRLVRELSLEGGLLVVVAAALAAAGALLLLRLLATANVVSESGIVLSDHYSTTATWLVMLSVVSWILVAVLPAIARSRQALTDAALSRVRATRRVSRVGAPLLLGQAATAIVVVALAGVALSTFARQSRIDMGFAMSGVTFVDVAVPDWRYGSAADRGQLMERLLAELRGVGAVREVAAVSVRPFRFGEIVDGQPVRRGGDALIQPDDAIGASRVVVTPEYFRALGQPLLAGRGFTATDSADNERVAIISRTLARAVFGAADAIGQSIETFSLSEKWRDRRVVGIVGDARYRGLERPSMEIYVPHLQVAPPLGSLVIASHAVLSPSEIRQAFDRVDPEVAVERLETTGDVRQAALSPARLLATVVSLLGGTGLLLLAMGIFGAAATALRAAWTEIAIRQAIGAQPLQAARAPLGLLARALLIGVVAGLALTPLALSGASALGLDADGALPAVSIAAVLVPLAAVAAVTPLLLRASSLSPAQLLRRD
jgi:predicted permease